MQLMANYMFIPLQFQSPANLCCVWHKIRAKLLFFFHLCNIVPPFSINKPNLPILSEQEIGLHFFLWRGGYFPAMQSISTNAALGKSFTA